MDEVKEIRDSGEWDAFALAHTPVSGGFLQSWAWGELLQASGQAVRRLGLRRDGTLVGIAQTAETSLPLGQRYIACSRGPLFADNVQTNPQALGIFLQAMRRQTGSLFARVEPICLPDLPSLPFSLKKSINITARSTLVTDLRQDEEALLSGMHPKTRYNVRLAEKKGVRTKMLPSSDLERVWPLFEETVERDRFRRHPKDHYAAILRHLSSENPRAFLAAAFSGEKILAANIMIDFGGTRTYLHGASSNEDRHLMAPYLLHWHLLLDAKRKGLVSYDWWGIAETDDPTNPWAGFTRFKKGFGGETVLYPGTFDAIFSPLAYGIYMRARAAARRARKLMWCHR